jgi:hypothetical protein
MGRILLWAYRIKKKLKKNTAGSIYNCTTKDVDVTTLSRRTSTAVCDAAQKPGFISAPPCCFLFCCHGHGSRRHLVSGTERHAVTSLFPARQPYLPKYKTSRQKKNCKCVLRRNSVKYCDLWVRPQCVICPMSYV